MNGQVRVASFNASLNRNSEGELIDNLSTPDDSQAQSVAEIIQRTNADIILINEFDFDADGEAARLFQENYLGVSQNGQEPVDYPHVFVAPSNTGIDSGLDLDNDGTLGGAGDAQGFGFFEGQFGFVVLSKHPIDEGNIRTFQEFLWKDMPGNLLTEDPTPSPDNLAEFYSPEEIEVLRLSSKNHVDLPVVVDGEIVHILAAHPTPPVFDGTEDRNGKRNHDEIRFWSDYADGADYIYDDNGEAGGLESGERFVIVGDYNADPFDGDSFDGAINQLLDNPDVNGSATDPAVTPDSEGGVDATDRQAGFNETHLGNPAFDTADFGFAGFDSNGVQNPDGAPGNLRVDYALPSEEGLAYLDGSVFWQAADDPLFPLAEFPTSDHRLVSVDLRLTNQNRVTVDDVEFIGFTEIPSFTEFDGTTIGGLSGIVNDPVTGAFLAVSDDRSDGDDGTPRFYEIEIDLSDGSLEDGDVEFSSVTSLTLPTGETFDALNPDPEGIAIGEGGQIYISSERDLFGNPAIYTVSDDGVVDGELPVDAKFQPNTDGTNGVRNNLGFESLTISPDQKTLWTATESALAQDGDRSSTELGSAARIVRYDLETGLPVAEYIYEVDKIAREPFDDGFADSGLVELLALDNQGTLLALERSFSVLEPGTDPDTDRGYTGKLFLVRTQGATNVIGENAVPVGEDDGELEVNVDETVSKELLVDLGDFGIVPDNIEGLALGPVLPDGRQSLVIMSDDNFSAFGPQANQFIALALELGEVPTIAPVTETPDELRFDNQFDESEGPDSDDSAVFVGEDPAETIIVTAMKNGGLRVYDLEGTEIQRIEPEGTRYNNVDVLYGAGRGDEDNLVIASDRENDVLAVFKIQENGKLKDVTAKFHIPDSIFGVDDGEATAYGLAAYHSPIDGKDYVFVTQADGATIAQLELKQRKNEKYNFEVVRTLELPVPGGADPEDFQSEGIVIDRETGIGYVAVEEELGLLSFQAELGGSDEFTTVAPIDSPFFEPDLEGVSIHYGEDGEGLILVSSQGDSTFAAFDRITNQYKGSFAVRGEGDIDGVEETDGIEIVSTGLPGFENGLFVSQDGSNAPEFVFPDAEEGEVQNYNTNFKLNDLGEVLEIFDVAANPDFDPRNVAPKTLPNGVAAGDVTEDSAVLWARSLAPGEVVFTVFLVRPDGRFRKIAKDRVEVTDTDVPVKLELDGLRDGREYVYQVKDAAGATAEGRFRTPHDDGHNGLSFGVSGDWRGELAPYPAISNAPEADLDFFLLHGDTIYADFGSPALPQEQAISLSDFRTKYEEVYGTRGGENFFADLFATTAIYATIDDHEVTNDFAGGETIGATGESEFRDLFPGDDPDAFVNDATLYENGLQAFHDFHAIREEFYGDTGDPVTSEERKLYRFQEFGNDAANFVLDQRSFRDEQLPGPSNFLDPAEVASVYASTFEPGRTLLGAQQLADLKEDLLEADTNGVTWKFIYTPEPIQPLFPGINTDSWDGYNAERSDLLSFIDDNDIDNVVFVAADVHATYVNNLTYQEEPFGEHIATNAFEITTGSVAFDPPTGLFLGDIFAGGDPAVQAFFDSLPIAPDTDNVPDDKDDFLKQAINDTLLAPFGYDPIGLNNGTEAESLIDAELLAGDFVASTTYGWTQFDIDADTQDLTVTTYGVDPYTEDEVLADPTSVVDLEPRIVSQFVVSPELETDTILF